MIRKELSEIGNYLCTRRFERLINHLAALSTLLVGLFVYFLLQRVQEWGKRRGAKAVVCNLRDTRVVRVAASHLAGAMKNKDV
jgi:hypothetical protein